MGIMKIILIRHASTEGDHIKGWTDIGLGSQGQTEAAKLAKSLAGLNIDFIVSSDLRRASETAKIINALLKVPLQLDQRLRECSFGKIEGLTKQQAIEQHGSPLSQQLDDQCKAYDFRPFSGESRDDVFARHVEVIKSFSADNPNKTAF